MPIFQPILIFLVYFALQAIIIPAFIYGGIAWQTGENVDFVAIPLYQQVWINIASMVLVTPVIWLFAFFLNPMHMRQLTKGSTLANLAAGIKMWFVAFPLSLLLGLLMNGIVEGLFHPIEVDQVAVQHFKMSFGHPWQFGLSIVGIVLAVPIAEELVFRGFLQVWLRQRISALWAIFLTSMVFSTFHYSSLYGWNNLTLLPQLFLLSCFLGVLFEYRQNIWAPIGLHSIFNFVSTLLIVYESRGDL